MAIILNLSTNLSEKIIIKSILPWIHEAGNPYFDWLFGPTEIVNNKVLSMIQNPVSELSLLKIRVLFLSDEIVGGYIALDGKELSVAQKNDTHCLMKSFKLNEKIAFLSRLEISRDLFSPVSDNEYFLSKIGVNGKYRKCGYGSFLLNDYLSKGNTLGFKNYRLNVHVNNLPAIKLYKKYGFKISSTSEIKNSSIKYHSMTFKQD